jgi:transcriptional regulator with XRE-family HTH domain
METFSDRLQAVLDLLGVSQTDLAKRIGCEASLINHYINNRREPSLSNLIKIKKGLNVSWDILLGE